MATAEVSLGAGQAVRRDQWVMVALLCSFSLACWAWSLGMAAQLGGSGGAHAHHHHGGAGSWPGLFAMWPVMMAGMMVPPELRLWTRLLKLRSELQPRPAPLWGMALFIGGYLAAWTAYSLGAAALQQRLQDAGLLGPDLALTDVRVAGAVLLAAGAAQFSSLKARCLQRCRAPGRELAQGGALDAAAAGLRHGAVSIGSCGALMLVLFVTGVMSPLWMGLVTLLLVVESAAPARFRASAVAGGLLLAWGMVSLLG